MKKRTCRLILFMIFFLFGSFAANAQVKAPLLGNWNFEAPTAPEGYNWGVTEFKKDTILMYFTNGLNKYVSSWIKVKNDSVKYESDIDGTTVLFSLKVIDKQKIMGNAVWEGGETVMTMTRKKE